MIYAGENELIYTEPQMKRYIFYILNYFIVKMKH